MLFFMSFLDQFFVNFERVWEALWAFLVALGAFWDDFFVKSLNDIFTTFHLQALGCHLGLILLQFWRVLGLFFRDFGPLGRRNAGTDFELKTQAIPVEVQNEFMQF